MSREGPFYPRQVWKRHWRKINRWMGRATAHEVVVPEGMSIPEGEIRLKYDNGKFYYLP